MFGDYGEAEYSFTVTDGTDFWTLIGFNVSNSSPRFGTVEGIAVIGGQGGFPPVGVALTVTDTQEGPVFTASSYATPICFTPGTLVRTPDGQRRIEYACRRGLGSDRRQRCAPAALDRHAQPAGARQIRTRSHQGRVLVAAKHLVNGTSVLLEEGGIVTYIHLLFDDHQIIWAEDAQTESLHPGTLALSELDQQARAEISELFPQLEHQSGQSLAAYPLKRHEARLVA